MKALAASLAFLSLVAPALGQDLPRPPSPPPGVDSPQLLQRLMNRYRVASEKHHFSLEWARAGAKTAWYTSWIAVHNHVFDLERSIAEVEERIARERDFGVDVSAHESRIALMQASLADARSALQGQAPQSTEVRQLVGVRLGAPLLYNLTGDGRWMSAPVKRPVAALAFLAHGFRQDDAYSARSYLEASQRWAMSSFDRCAPAERDALRDYARRAGACIAALDDGRFEEVVAFYDEEWRAILEWGADLDTETVEASATLPLEIAPLGRVVSRRELDAIRDRKKATDRRDALERNRLDQLALFTQIWSKAGFAAGERVSFARVRDRFTAPFGVGWEDVSAGGRAQRVPKALRSVEKRLTTWIDKTKDSVGGVPRARALVQVVRQAQRDYDAEDFAAVQEALAALRAWILEGSEFPVH